MRALVLRVTRYLAILAVVGCMAELSGPVDAGEAARCDGSRAASFRATADHYREHKQFAQAAQSYLVASHWTTGCRTSAGALLDARSLLQAGGSLAMSSDFGRAISVLRAAQSRLSAIEAGDGRTAEAVRSSLEVVAGLIATVNEIARASM